MNLQTTWGEGLDDEQEATRQAIKYHGVQGELRHHASEPDAPAITMMLSGFTTGRLGADLLGHEASELAEVHAEWLATPEATRPAHPLWEPVATWFRAGAPGMEL